MSSFLGSESSFIGPDPFGQFRRDSLGNTLRDSFGNPLRRESFAQEAAQVLRNTDQSIANVVEESEDLAASEVAMEQQAGADPTEINLRVAIMKVLTPLLAVGDLIKNGVAYPNTGLTVTGAIDAVADLTVLGNQLRVYCTRGEIVGFGFTYMLIALVQSLESLNGFGRADTGEAFGSGASGFDALGALLSGADVDPSRWSGPAAQGYAALNADLKSLAAQLTELDRAMAGVIQAQAADIAKVRVGLASVKAAFVSLALIMPALISLKSTKATLLLALRIMAGFVISGLLSALGLLAFAISAGWKHGRSAQGMIEAYEKAAAEALAKASAPSSAPSSASVASVSSATPATATAPAPSAAAPAPRTAPAAAAAAAGAADPSDPTPTPTPKPAPMPTLGQIAETVGIASQVEAGLAQATTQGMQSVQQFASMAGQAAHHAPVGPPGPVLAGAVKDADSDGDSPGEPMAEGADGGIGAGRAPVDAGRPATTTRPETLA